MKFIKPSKDIIGRTRAYTEYRAYTDPFISSIYWHKLREAFNYLQKRRWDTILEIGCGYGYLLPSLCQIGRRVVGSDIGSIFELCQKVTLEEIKKRHPKLELKATDARHLSSAIDKESCDVIIAISVLEHIPEYQIAIQEIRKCLRNQGIFLCVLPTENLLYKIARMTVRYTNEYHKDYHYKQLRTYLSKKLRPIKTWFFPLHLPLFFYGVYQK